jgi:hypothetical protein
MALALSCTDGRNEVQRTPTLLKSLSWIRRDEIFGGLRAVKTGSTGGNRVEVLLILMNLPVITPGAAEAVCSDSTTFDGLIDFGFQVGERGVTDLAKIIPAFSC